MRLYPRLKSGEFPTIYCGVGDAVIMKYLKRLFLSFMLFDNFITQRLKSLFPPQYMRVGSCKKCGSCCREIHLRMTRNQINNDFFRNLCIRWLSWLYDFVLVRVDYDRYYLVFTCKHIGNDGKCLNYSWRPPICRNFPLTDYFAKPVYLPGCGFGCD